MLVRYTDLSCFIDNTVGTMPEIICVIPNCEHWGDESGSPFPRYCNNNDNSKDKSLAVTVAFKQPWTWSSALHSSAVTDSLIHSFVFVAESIWK